MGIHATDFASLMEFPPAGSHWDTKFGVVSPIAFRIYLANRLVLAKVRGASILLIERFCNFSDSEID